MAVYTRVPFDTLKQFVDRYELGGLKAAHEIIEGVENSNYRIDTDNGPFILTIYEKRVKAEDLPFFIEMMQQGARKGLPCPLPLADRQGNIIQELSGKPATIVTFLEGEKILNPDAAHCRQAGALLAHLHRATSGMQGTRTNALNRDGWKKLVEACAARADTVAPGLCDLMQATLKKMQASWPQDGLLPSGVIHADFFPDNVFFKNGHASAVIDFYFACNDFCAYDLAITINSWAFEKQKTYNARRAAALIEGYESVRPLLAAEKKALPLLAEGAALRFLLTRTFDVLNHPEGALVKPHDPLEYRDKLVFFRDNGLPL